MNDPLSLSRRGLIAGAAALALPGRLLAGALPSLPDGARRLTFHIVDGWVLTSEDLDALGLHAR